MDPYGRNNDYRGNAHMAPSVFISSRKAYYRIDDLSSRAQQPLQSSTTSSATNNSPYLYRQYPLLNNISKAVVKKTDIDKTSSPSNTDIQMESNKPRKIFEIVSPPVQYQPEVISPVLSTNLNEQTDSQLFSGQYHYPPEIEETEIYENDPENTDMKSVVGELPELIPFELLSLEQFRREQSALRFARVLIFVPEFIENMESELTERTKKLPQSSPVNTDTAQSSYVPPSKNIKRLNKQNILNFAELIRIAPKIKLPPVPKPKVLPKPVELPIEVKPDLKNTMLHRPVKHVRVSIETEKKPPPPSRKPIVKTHSVSDFSKKDVTSIDPIRSVLPTQPEVTTNDDTSSVVIEQSQTSSINSHPPKVPRPSPPKVHKVNPVAKEKIPPKIDTVKKDSITSTPKLPTKKSVPTSTRPKTKAKFPWEDTNSEDNRVNMFNFGFNIVSSEIPR